MRRNGMRKNGRGLFSGKRGRAAALSAAVCILCALSILSGETAAKVTGLLDTVSAPASTQKSQVAFQAEAVTEGEHYDTLMAQVAEDAENLIAPPQVMELTASLGETKLDLSGCQITVQVDPTPALVETAIEDGAAAASLDEDDGGTLPGMVLTVQPLGGEAVTRFFSGEELESGQLSPVVISYTVPKGTPAMYAMSARAVENAGNQLTEDETRSEQVVITEDTVIDLNGHTITCADPFVCQPNPDGDQYAPSLFVVRPGATLTIVDSSAEKTGCIENPNLWLDPLIHVLDGGTLSVQGGKLDNMKHGRVIQADGNSTVNVSGGTITGGNSWGGGGIYMASGTVNISGGKIADNDGGGIYAASGTVSVSGGEITENKTGGYGGGIYMGSGKVNISGGKITKNVSSTLGGGIYANSGAVNVSGGEIAENEAGNHGGGIYVSSGTVNISGSGKIANNTGGSYGGGVCCGILWGNPLDNGGHVVMTGGEISGNKVTAGSTLGGGVCANTMELSGGTISGNTANFQGGGVYAAEKLTMTGGTISGNTAINTSDPNGMNSDGGGVWATRMDLSGGTIDGNHAQLRGGGVYTTSMTMTGGTVSNNTVIGYTVAGDTVPAKAGGGGIYIDKGEYVFDDGGAADSDHGRYNMSITGGTISNNTSNYVGGGIFIANLARVHIRGTNGTVRIAGNQALDERYAYNANNGGHGFGGGGIFVEHPSYEQGADLSQGGYLYLYDAVITGNKAQHGGGVAGCGASRIIISRLSGIAVYDNEITGTDGETFGTKIPASKDLYSDGKGIVDSVMPGGGTVTWIGKQAETAGDNTTLLDVNFDTGVIEYLYGFYLKADEVSEEDKAAARNAATVFIEGNTSRSGGGGIGGNGYMELGYEPPDEGSLTLEKIVEGPALDPEHEFTFTIELRDSTGNPLTGGRDIIKVLRSGARQKIHVDNAGRFTVMLKSKECVILDGFKVETQYKITEDSHTATGFRPAITVDGAAAQSGDADVTWSVEGKFNGKNRTMVRFTNEALTYELPATGGISPALYIGGALLLTAAVGFPLHQKRTRKKDG